MYSFENQSTSMLFRDERCLVLIHPSEKVEFEVFNGKDLFGLFFFNRSPKILLYTIQVMRVVSWEFTFITVLEWVCLFLINVLMCLKISSQSRLRSDLQWTWDVSQMLMIFEDSNCILFLQRIFILNSAENLVCSTAPACL